MSALLRVSDAFPSDTSNNSIVAVDEVGGSSELWPLDQEGRLAVDVGLALADSTILRLARRGDALERWTATLTTSRDGQDRLEVAVVASVRPRHTEATLVIATATRAIAPSPRGVAQIRVQVTARRAVLRITLEELGSSERTTRTITAREGTIEEALPAVWRFEVGAPHSAFAFGDGWVTLEQRAPRQVSSAPMGADGDVDASFTASRVWPAAHALAAELSRSSHEQVILELGAGTGLVGLALLKSGARHAILTDLEANLPLLRRNAESNGLAGRSTVVELDWTSEALPDVGHLDVVLAADCVFWPFLFEPLLDTFQRLWDRQTIKPQLWLSLTRRLDRADIFLRQVQRRGWDAQKQQTDDLTPLDTEIYRLVIPAASTVKKAGDDEKRQTITN